MKNYLLLLFLFLASIVAKADDQVLQIWQSDGKVMTIKLSEEPKTSYVDGNLVIKTTKTTITFPLEKVKKYTYASEPSGIDSPIAMQSEVSADGETLTFKGIKPNTSIYLYNAAGQLLRTIKSDKTNKATVSVSRFPIGVYIVKVNGVTYKITKQ